MDDTPKIGAIVLVTAVAVLLVVAMLVAAISGGPVA